ncbi:MFS family permease [Saccharothrix ecbatanensis]|jgi:MFS family permease|uniref:MFS family permease n=1 Tax=Saccharothrix ecbatanensis TaxID=1105145 RepID=A0A7W9HU55_9PSEU|nr:MFS transporter [Saccharothrix ecbatanensis]MBB5808575.1 MFS family permease [Saccharothrix ecbatanensis]
MTTALERTRWGAVFAVSSGIVLAALDMTAVAVALPVLGADLSAGPSVTQWVLLAYNIPLIALSIPAGRWLDRAGHLPAFLLAVGGFGATSLLIAVAPNTEVVLVGRALQGAFSALIGAVTMPIIAGNVRPQHRARAMGIVLTLIPLSGVAGPAFGGLLTDLFGWRSVFLINLPVVAVAVLAGRRGIADDGRGLPWPGRRILVESVVFSARVVRRRSLALPLVALPLMVAGVGALNFVVPYLLVDLPSRTVGLVLLALSAGMAVLSPIAGVIADRYGYRTVALTGAAVILIGTVLLLRAGDDPWDLAWRLAVIGIGHGLFAGPNAAALLARTPPELMGTAGGMTTLVRTVGFSVGPALGASLGGFHPTVVVLVVITALGVLATAAQQRAD